MVHPLGENVGQEPSELKAAESDNRPYNHLINDEADSNLFNKTFPGADNTDAATLIARSNDDEGDKKTGFVYYDNCVDHYCLWDENYEENPKRFSRTFERMKELDLIEKCRQIEPRKATENEILLAHTAPYLEKISSLSNIIDPSRLELESSKYDAVYFNPNSYEAALYAAGSTIQLAENVVTGRIQNGFALVRPPGHHAMASEACGYCIFNNVAIAASYCINKYDLKRVLIVDWDVHHGQATQQAFYNDKRVLYASIHRYEMGAYWPQLIESNYSFIGEDKGRRYNVNIPLNDIGLCDSDYLSIWHNVLLPIFYEYNPELVLISSGYDAAIGCPEGEMLLSPSFYAHATHSLKALANGKVCVVLEGGYCIESLADSAAYTLRTLLGDPPVPIKMKYPINQSVVESVLDVLSVLRPYWSFICLQKTFNRHEEVDVEESPRKRHFPMIEYHGQLELLPERPQSYPTRECYPMQDDLVKSKYANAIEILRVHADNHYASYSQKRTCIIKMSDISRRHACANTHPERPNRISFLWKFLKTENILDRCYIITDNNRSATEDQIRLCHSEKAIDAVRLSQLLPYKDMREYESQFDSLYLTQDTYQVAKLASGSLLQVVDCVMQNECLNGFAAIRPPGHHASRDSPAGFCIFNNCAIAARYAIEKFNLSRVLILDWDIHHGDGTQDIVINDERFLFVSLHRYDNAAFYPEKLDSNFNVSKNVINIPWNGGPMGDKEYLAAYFNIILPIAYNFNPELVFVSAGFDAAQGDPLGEYNLSPQAYGHMTHMLGSLAGGKIILTLEGGYNLKSIADSASECIKVLLGDPPGALSLDEDGLNECAIETMQNVIDYHSTNWPCLAFNVDIPETKL